MFIIMDIPMIKVSGDDKAKIHSPDNTPLENLIYASDKNHDVFL